MTVFSRLDDLCYHTAPAPRLHIPARLSCVFGPQEDIHPTHFGFSVLDM